MITIKDLTRDYLGKVGQMADKVFPDTKVLPSIGFKASIDPEVAQDLNKDNDNPFIYLKYWVAVDDDKDRVVGVIGLYKELKDAKDTYWLGWFCVDPAFRGKGIGTKLLKFAINKAKKQNKKYLRLYTSTDIVEADAQRLYEKHGFKTMDKPHRFEGRFEIFYRELVL